VKAKGRLVAGFSRSGAGRNRSSDAFATRGASADADWSGAGSHARRRAATASVVGLLALLSVLVPLSVTASADTSFGEGPNDAGNLAPFGGQGIGVDPSSGDLYVANAQRISKFEGDGTSLFAFGWGQANGAEEQQTCTVTCQLSFQVPFTHNSVKGAMLAGPSGVAVDPTSGDVYVTDTSHQRIEKFDSDGNFFFSFGGDVVAYGPDNSANNESQKVTVTAEGGTFKLVGPDYPYALAYNDSGSFSGGQTAALPYNATAAEVESALDALGSIGGLGGSVSVTGGPGNATGSQPYEITFEDNLGGDDIPPLHAITEEGEPPASTLTGATHSVAIETLANGGGAEVCKPTAGDVCKYGGRNGNGANGTFGGWPERADLIAVDAAGTVYVGDVNRVQKFSSEGAYTGQINVPGGGRTQAVAVDSSDNTYVISEEVSGVQEFNPAGILVRTLHPVGTPKLLTADGSGHVFVGTELENGEPTVAYEFAEYDATGTLLAQFHSPLIRSAGNNYFYHVNGIAVSDFSHELYAANSFFGGFEEDPEMHIVAIPLPVAGPPTVTERPVTDIQPTTATLHALVNPHSHDTHYHFEYVDQESFEHEGGFSSPNTQSTPSTDLGLVDREDPVQAAISALSPGTSYQYRVVAENSEGTVYGPAELATLPPLSIRDFTTQTVGPELVTLKAELNPNGKTTEYTFHFGKDTTYSGGTASGEIPIGNEFVKKEVTFIELAPNTTYHYQLIGSNENGDVETADQTFTTERTVNEEAAAANCANANLREEDSALALPDCRDYEQVSPAFKGGYNALHGDFLAPSGERALFFSIGDLGGAVQNTPPLPTQYLAQRTADGWVTQVVVKNPAGKGFVPQPAVQFSPELDRWIFEEYPALSSGNLAGAGIYEAETGAVYMGHADGTFNQASPIISRVEPGEFSFMSLFGVATASDDLSHYFIETAARDLQSDARPTVETGSINRIYEISGADGPSPSMKLVAEVPLGLPDYEGCFLNEGNTQYGGHGGRRVSVDGSTIIYVVPIEEVPGAGCGGAGPNPIGLFAHVGETAIQLNAPSASQCSSPSPCATAPNAHPEIVGLSPDGSRAWFTTTQPLVNSDKDSTEDLYFAKLKNGELKELVQASAGDSTDPTPGEDAGVQGVNLISPDGSHVSFVAAGVLTTEPNSSGDVAEQGAYNLYGYNSGSGETNFVARICKAPGQSGSLADQECPPTFSGGYPENDRGLWESQSGNNSHFTPDGRFLIFTSYAHLAPGDTDNAQDLYRYDFQTEQLIRLSFGRNGNDGNGNDSAHPVELPAAGGGVAGGPAETAEAFGRAISADGSTIIFRTTAPLVSRDTNLGTHPGCGPEETGCDLYEWMEAGHGTCHEAAGCISLISDGLDVHGIFGGTLSASGRDITFYTPRGLVPADTDGVGDIYDARIEGGFHTPHPPADCGSPEACRPAAGAAPAAPTLGSESFVGPGNSKEHLECAKGKRRVVRHGQVRCVAKHNKKKHHKAKHKRAGANRGGAK
jgi:NHL repeat/WD40-like Beta Propeller Repeat